jgi:hypothetical protein
MAPQWLLLLLLLTASECVEDAPEALLTVLAAAVEKDVSNVRSSRGRFEWVIVEAAPPPKVDEVVLMTSLAPAAPLLLPPLLSVTDADRADNRLRAGSIVNREEWVVGLEELEAAGD